jgi:hypothetical protein
VRSLVFVVFSYASKATLKIDRKLEEEEEEEATGATSDIVWNQFRTEWHHPPKAPNFRLNCEMVLLFPRATIVPAAISVQQFSVQQFLNKLERVELKRPSRPPSLARSNHCRQIEWQLTRTHG